MPNIASEIAVVGAPSPTVADINVTLGGLTVQSGGVLNVDPGRNFNFDPTATIVNQGAINIDPNTDFQLANVVTNDGTITLDGSGSVTDLELVVDATLDGDGEVVLAGDNARFNDAGGLRTLTNGENHTIRGSGNIGANTINLINDGLIVADVSLETLFIDPNGNNGTLINSGTARAIGGAVLALNGGVYNNAGGVIESAGGQVRINNLSEINGGTLTGADIVVSAMATATIADLGVDGPVVVEDDATLITEGMITNNATITLASVAAATELSLQSATNFAGNGTIVLDGPDALIRDTGGTQTLTNGVNHTIRGRGSVGFNTINLVNDGLIVADVAGETLFLDPNANNGTLTNTGTARAVGGAVLALNGGVYNNAGGVIESAGGQVRINSNAEINGGTLTGADIVVSTAANVTLADLAVDGPVAVENGAELITSGTITNNDTITLANADAITEVALVSSTTFSGNGTLVLSGPNSRIGVTGGSHTLTNGAGHTIVGDGGSIGPSNTLSIINNGVIAADGDTNGAPLIINPAGGATSSSFSGSGVIRAINGGDIFLETAGYQFEDGLFEAIGPGSTIDRSTSVFNVFFGSFRAIDGGQVRIFDQGPDGALTFDGDLIGNQSGDLIELRGATSDTDIFNNTAVFDLGNGQMVGRPVSGPGSGYSRLFAANEGTFIIGDDYDFRAGGFGGGDFTNSGTIVAETGSTFSAAGYDILGFTTESSTIFQSTSANAIVNTGTLAGSGTIANSNTLFGQAVNRITNGFGEGDFIESDGIIAPGDSATETGTLTLHARDIILGDSNDIQIDIGAGGFDAVEFITEPTDGGPGNPDIINTVELNGELSVNLLGGFIPASGETFEILTADDGFISTFDTETLPTLGGILEWTVDYGATAVTLQAFLVGDFDEDGDVDGADFLVWQREDGTPTGLAAWQATYGSGVGSLQAATTVPEPLTATLVMTSVAICATRRRR